MPTEIAWHASHEELPPDRLLELAVRAEQAGFDGVHSSDHLAPWFPDGESGHAWSWLGAAMARTHVPFGVVTAPGQRYHPVVHAQAIATLARLFPGRLTVSLGSGEATNEHVTGDPWPEKPARNARLATCAGLFRDLLAGETVDCDDPVVHRGRLYSLPDQPPRLFAAAMTPETAAEVAGWADGLITVGSDPDAVRRVVDAFREHGGDSLPVHLQVHVAWAADDEAAQRLAVMRWPVNALPPAQTQDLETPEEVARAVAGVDPATILSTMVASADLDRHVTRLAELCEIGLERLVVHQVGPDQAEFIDVFAQHVLPRLR
ncbi:TIGR03557 family F420-dependent LLM class oxidoreductase [Nocardioides sp. LHG3406-4]|uniref:TIGR03557 family F420-dependent LLM class oxidoreductase n=1 Tax=Nocardioides sp. LHG3406-4 TaxID=2804575 RepID=UPI003CF323BE